MEAVPIFRILFAKNQKVEVIRDSSRLFKKSFWDINFTLLINDSSLLDWCFAKSGLRSSGFTFIFGKIDTKQIAI